MIYLGIDPGSKGAMAILDVQPDDRNITIIPFDEDKFANTMSFIWKQVKVCCLEEVHAMPHQGVVSMFSFGENYGKIQGMLKSYNIPFQKIKPQTWKKEFALGGKTKQDSIAVCRSLFPEVTLKLTDRCKTESDGMAEALLMAEYARRKL